MSSGCGDVLSLADLQTAKKHQIFEAEVITGKSGGVASGADIDYATNQVTGQTQKTLPAVLRDAGFSPVSWDFSTGGTLTVNDRDKVVYDPVSKTWYSYAGTLPVTVPAGFNPVGNADWKPQTDPDLRNDLAELDGGALVGAATYAQVRAYSGTATRLNVIGRTTPSDGGAGLFYLDAAGSSATDDDGVVLVDSLNRRWKRIYDGPIMASWYGVTDGSDVSAELQGIFTKGGGQVFVKDGQYTLSSTVVSDHTGASYPVIARKSSRFDFIGSSMTNTVFNTNGITGLSFIGTDGSVAGQGVHSGMKIKDFSVYGTGNTGVGVRLTGAAYLKVEDLYLVRHNVGMSLKGILSSDIKRINAQYNNYGMYIETGLNSTFNAMRISGMFGGNSTCGIEGEVGTNVYIEDSNFEGNGTNGLINSGAIYLRVKEPLSTINISAYFEANIGDADITIDNLTSSPVVVNLRGCVFNRGGGAGGGNAGLGCNYNFQAKSTGGGKVILNLDGCVFFTQTSSGYAPSATKPYILKAPYLVVNGEDTCYFSETTSRGETGNRSLSLGLSVNADGTCVNNPPFITVTRASAGVYTINHSDQFAPDTGHFQVVATSKASGTRVYYAQKVNLQSIRVVTVNDSNTVTDAAFDVVITSRR